VAALVGGVAYFAGAIANVWVGFNLAAATSAKIPEADAARLLVTTFKAGVANGFLTVYFLGGLLGTLLIGIALWRSRAVPRWLPALFVVGNVVASFAPPGLVSVPLSLPFTAAMFILAWRIWQAASPPAAQVDEAIV
jgi:hypothetical protein